MQGLLTLNVNFSFGVQCFEKHNKTDFIQLSSIFAFVAVAVVFIVRCTNSSFLKKGGIMYEPGHKCILDLLKIKALFMHVGLNKFLF